MRAIIAFLLITTLTGCGVEVLTTTAITSDLQSQQLSQMQKQIEYATGQTGKVNLQRAVDLYFADKGTYPQTLDEVAPTYIASVPLQTNGAPYGYTPSTGRVFETDSTTPTTPTAPTSPTAPATAAGPTQLDMQNLRTLGTAIQQFTQQNRRYPASLQALVPQYITQVPRTNTGQAFVYNPQTGQVFHPQAQTAPAGRPRGTVQQQPQQQWDQSRGFGNERTQRQMQTMDELGL